MNGFDFPDDDNPHLQNYNKGKRMDNKVKSLNAALNSLDQLRRMSFAEAQRNNLAPDILDEILQHKLTEFVTALEGVDYFEATSDFLNMVRTADKRVTRNLIKQKQKQSESKKGQDDA